MIINATDYLLKLELADIGLLNEVAFKTVAPEITSSAYSVCFWFYTSQRTGIQIIANRGNKTLAQTGWTVYLQDSSLVFRCNSHDHDHDHDYDHDYEGQEIVTTLPDGEHWHHFVGISDPETELTAYLNGLAQSWQPRAAQELVEPGSVNTDDYELTIGGYTDAAGGHFNYRFADGLVDDFCVYARVLSAHELSNSVARDNKPLSAEFSINITHEIAPARASFAATRQANNIAYLWDFGDDSRALGATVSHAYAYAGKYPVKLTVVSESHAHTCTIQEIVLQGAENPVRPRPVFINSSGDDYACFRIPAIVRACNGDLIAFAEGRVADCSDATQSIHIVCKRSDDNGKTWQPLQVVARNVINGEDYACMNPAPVVDYIHGTGKIIVVFSKMRCSEWAITQGQGISRVCYVISEDHGKTWQEAQDITRQVHKPDKPADWRKQVPTLGHAIQLRGTSANPSTNGRLFYIGCRTEGDESVFYTQNYAFWSDDLGASWQIGAMVSVRDDGSSAKGLGEAVAVELADGSVMINSRNYQDGKVVGARAVTIGCFDRLGNISFAPVRHDAALIDSGVQASLIRHNDVLVFANPEHPDARLRLTVRFSFDQGKTWPVSKLIDPGPAAYSDLVIQENDHIGLLYEQGNHGGIAYVDFPLA